MNNLQKRIELLEAQCNEAELLAQLASDPDIRMRNRQLAERLRAEAQKLRDEVKAVRAA